MVISIADIRKLIFVKKFMRVVSLLQRTSLVMSVHPGVIVV